MPVSDGGADGRLVTDMVDIGVLCCNILSLTLRSPELGHVCIMNRVQRLSGNSPRSERGQSVTQLCVKFTT